MAHLPTKPRLTRPYKSLVEVYPSGGGWRIRTLYRGFVVDGPSPVIADVEQASRRAVAGGSPWLVVYRREVDGSWTYLRAPQRPMRPL